MAYQGLHVLAVVPARGGSKSIHRKNLCLVGGGSLVGRAARVALSLPWLDHAILSTDDEEIAAEGRRCGLDVPFMRPEELAGDLANSIDMWRHAILASEQHYRCRFELSILLEPTSPMRTSEDVEQTIAALLNGDHLAAATVSPTPAHYTPHKTLTVDEYGHIGFYLQGGSDFSIRQKIPPYFHRNGICYAVKRETVVDRRQIIEEKCAAVVMDRPVVNIDEPFDLELAAFLLERRAGRNTTI